MRIESFIDEFIDSIKKDDYFSDIKIIKAYPCTEAPVRLLKETIALGFDKVDFTSISIDDSNRAGSISVFADIFIPLKKDNGRAGDIFSRLCRSLCRYNVISVSAQRTVVDNNTASYVMKTEFTFNDEIEVV